MSKYEFKIYIETIGFKIIGIGYYEYKEYSITFYDVYYNFYNGSGWINYNYNDLTPIKENFKKELRSYKLKALLI